MIFIQSHSFSEERIIFSVSSNKLQNTFSIFSIFFFFINGFIILSETCILSILLVLSTILILFSVCIFIFYSNTLLNIYQCFFGYVFSNFKSGQNHFCYLTCSITFRCPCMFSLVIFFPFKRTKIIYCLICHFFMYF